MQDEQQRFDACPIRNGWYFCSDGRRRDLKCSLSDQHFEICLRIIGYACLAQIFLNDTTPDQVSRNPEWLSALLLILAFFKKEHRHGPDPNKFNARRVLDQLNENARTSQLSTRWRVASNVIGINQLNASMLPSAFFNDWSS
ncbi:hypothetical protein RF11_06534 [Thelohanellus kitauei]|uniref:Uncharacterized protein n=1 Tax=Thelohanellus kitauei TaxID=669202 RepID=A0A0C2N5B4_THEKT|nr:hypothetical protein RF11_06534 [Thelohanellus kitauei]